MDTETFIRKPFRVEAVTITRENIEEIAPTIGKLRHKDNGEPWIKADRDIIPNVRNVFLGFVLTDVRGNKRCYSPKAFAREFMRATDEWMRYIDELEENEKENDMGTSSQAESNGEPTGVIDAVEATEEDLPTADPEITKAAEAAMAGMTADERAVVEDHLAIPGVGEALAQSLAKGDVEEVLPTEEERAAAAERMAQVQESLGIPDLSEERANEAKADASAHGVVCSNCGSKNLTPVGRGYSCNGCGHHEVNLDGSKAADAGL